VARPAYLRSADRVPAPHLASTDRLAAAGHADFLPGGPIGEAITRERRPGDAPRSLPHRCALPRSHVHIKGLAMMPSRRTSPRVPDPFRSSKINSGSSRACGRGGQARTWRAWSAARGCPRRGGQPPPGGSGSAHRAGGCPRLRGERKPEGLQRSANLPHSCTLPLSRLIPL